MGMYNYVAFSMRCPRCTWLLEDFQTKDGDNLDLRCVLPHTVDYFYTNCPNCELWVDFQGGEMTAPTYDTGAGRLPCYPPGKNGRWGSGMENPE